jgi:putative membrane protein
MSAQTFPAASTNRLLLGIGLYYGVLAFNLSMTFWIGEWFMGLSGLLMHLPVFALVIYRLINLPPAPSPSSSSIRSEEFV